VGRGYTNVFFISLWCSLFLVPSYNPNPAKIVIYMEIFKDVLFIIIIQINSDKTVFIGMHINEFRYLFGLKRYVIKDIFMYSRRQLCHMLGLHRSGNHPWCMHVCMHVCMHGVFWHKFCSCEILSIH